jgi:heat shock protein HslJ
MTGRRGLSSIGAVLAVLLSACAASSGGSVAAPSTTADLTGRTYISVGLDAAAPRPLVSGSQVRLAFTAQGIATSAGCNSLSGAARIYRGRLVLDAPMSSTEMACSPPLMRQEQWWATFLAGTPQVDATERSLVLRDNGTTVTLTNEQDAVPDRSLTGTRWHLDGVVDADTVSSLPSGTDVIVAFTSTAVTFQACNHYRATYQTSGSTLSIGRFTLVGQPLPCPSTAGPLADRIERVLSGAPTYAIDQDQLTVTNGTHGLQLRAINH